jgi:hypothetical protein
LCAHPIVAARSYDFCFLSVNSRESRGTRTPFDVRHIVQPGSQQRELAGAARKIVDVLLLAP